MSHLRLLVTAVTLVASALSAFAQSSRETVSFNTDWLFSRYGLQADGARLAEPGKAHRRFLLSASSEQSANTAEAAMDGSPNTRWCANTQESGQWLAIDLEAEQYVNHADIQWETPGLTYGYVVERSADGKNWQALPGPAQRIRITVKSLPAGRWASIREVHLFDNSGAELQNKTVAAGASPADAAFNDGGWRKLDVPHDWAIEGPFREDLPGNTAKLPWKGIGWYRKHFSLSPDDMGKRIFIDFDGAIANAEVWLNGQSIGGWPYGYQGFRLELTDKLKFGEENVIAVRLDTERWDSRWYPGAGIYRNVWLVKTAPVHVAQWGVFVTTPKIEPASGEADIAMNIDNEAAKDAQVSAQTSILELGRDDSVGREVATSSAVERTIPGNSSAHLDLTAKVTAPKLWDVASPNRYLARTRVSVGGKVADSYDQPFGFRTIEFTHDDGFHLNGKRVQIQGTCNHHDLGSLGAAFNTSGERRQLEILKAMGCNALRTSHNPPAPELLDLADKLGFLVMCEAFDCWKQGKTPYDYSALYPQWHEKDLGAMVRHFRNHPSIILWSTGNEIAEQGTLNPARELHDIISAEDATRPVSAGAWDAAARTEFRHGVDVQGLNYAIGTYTTLLNYPGNETKPFFASESSSCMSSRGEYFFGTNESNFQVSSYDLDAPGWGRHT